MRLADLTTLRVGGPIASLIEAHDEDTLVEAVRGADEAGDPLLVIGGGSNLLASDEPFAGTVVVVRDPGTAPRIDLEDDGAQTACSLEEAGVMATDASTSGPATGATGAPGVADAAPFDAACGGALVEHFAGVEWDRAVEHAVRRHLVGIEALSGIPGSVGATPIQNVGAYGQEVAQTIARVRTWDRQEQRVRTFTAAECAFAYRDSVFKRTRFEGAAPSATGRWVVLSVTFQHHIGSVSAPVRYAELARRLGVEAGQRVPMDRLREEVLRIRAGKGMVLDPADHDTWSAGSFFTNPILPAAQAERLPEDAPRFPTDDGRVKTSAAWLISHAGFDRGFAVGPRASLSTKHSLALTNRGGATAADIAELARTVQSGVQDRFGIHLEPEPVRLGVDL
ncbi:UDP-N-acetylmuramate dehydrogenase [Brachybacterium sp. EF45031]|uniref:UDP-N-acetylmuramate dehydrogenase n=1 Tax=Brachybacterium sillae TaxID=2810536 RepID=UPI00217E0DA2|nr:UDP-N-acetylmuramate dehydrogenase [Brachybacterium sillae]MCS6711079.1 UDP-N-acetylmuramate dehydrogenase [Brachybacterium sillae]